MTHFVEVVGNVKANREVGSVYIQWDVRDEDSMLLFVAPGPRVRSVLGSSDVLYFPDLRTATRFLSGRDAAIGNMTVLL
jgi:hypothetical protein